MPRPHDAPVTPARLAEYQRTQAALLRQGAWHVAPGGRLIYATCSILPSEGRAQIEAFVAESGKAFRVLDAAKVWKAALGTQAPFAGPYMLLTPHRVKTDGFFAAVLERAK